MTLSFSKKFLLGLVLAGFAIGQVFCAVENKAANPEYFKGYVAQYFGVQALGTPSKTTMAVIAGTAFLVASSYVALTQEKQPVIQTDNPFLKAWDWYRRVFCGQASKKSQKGYLTQTQAHINDDGTIEFDADLKIKDAYSESSGIMGTVITWYDANEKDVKKALGIGAMPLALFFGYMKLTSPKEFAIQHASKAPYGEFIAKA